LLGFKQRELRDSLFAARHQAGSPAVMPGSVVSATVASVTLRGRTHRRTRRCSAAQRHPRGSPPAQHVPPASPPASHRSPNPSSRPRPLPLPYPTAALPGRTTPAENSSHSPLLVAEHDPIGFRNRDDSHRTGRVCHVNGSFPELLQ